MRLGTWSLRFGAWPLGLRALGLGACGLRGLRLSPLELGAWWLWGFVNLGLGVPTGSPSGLLEACCGHFGATFKAALGPIDPLRRRSKTVVSRAATLCIRQFCLWGPSALGIFVCSDPVN